ncbi:MAG: calcium/sodium antiporter [Saprospiraceae bacterium]|nr:calcium/sodium antiporter [Saprospiraceae bacterium]
MELIAYIGLFVVSLFVLVKASDWFVSGAEAIGLSLGISPFIIGVTIVAFGTSLPELAASIAAVVSGASEIVVGNVVGSNITNILLVLGLTAIFSKKIQLDRNAMAIDISMLIASALLLWFALTDLRMSWFDIVVFLIGMFIFLMNSISGDKDDLVDRPAATSRNYLMVLVGAGLVYGGAHFTIVAIQEISMQIGINPEIIALTCVALGTSLPEVVVSITAARRGNSGIAIGNVLGSNLFNTFAVMGIPALLGPLVIPQSILGFSLPVMVVVTAIFAGLILAKQINRVFGLMLVVGYVFFLYFSFV